MTNILISFVVLCISFTSLFESRLGTSLPFVYLFITVASLLCIASSLTDALRKVQKPEEETPQENYQPILEHAFSIGLEDVQVLPDITGKIVVVNQNGDSFDKICDYVVGENDKTREVAMDQMKRAITKYKEKIDAKN